MRSTSATQTLLDTLHRLLGLWTPPRPWAVGYSGGRDSAVLLWALVRLTGPGGLTALHVDHGWRPAGERAEEATEVSRWCAHLGVALRSFGPPGSPGASEAGARAFRYACFRAFVDTGPGGSVFLAHHADDQAETILMRILQGRSWQGLAGIPDRRGPFYRPFLGLRRSVLDSVARDEGIPFHEDSTNLGEGPSRNYLRHRILPAVEARFPRAVPALNDFGLVWGQAFPRPGLSSQWTPGPDGYLVPSEVWDGWPVLAREGQLLAVASVLQPGVRVSRRFLEAVCEPGRTRGARGAGWSWSRSREGVRWGLVVQRSPKEYLVQADREGTWNLGSYRLSWSGHGGQRGNLEVPGVDPDRPWVWRSAVPGMALASAGDPDWGRARKRKRLGTLDPGRCALVLQDALVCAVVDPRENRLVWAETRGEKLHKTGIFVTLVWVT